MIVNDWKPFTITTKSSILDIAVVLDLPLPINESQFFFNLRFGWTTGALFAINIPTIINNTPYNKLYRNKTGFQFLAFLNPSFLVYRGGAHWLH